ncbi:MAG TPA: metal-dependent transcriptional regulator [Vicinamibacterales bacterium]|jgi:DtxR family Mn-dependent transcriptional regulator|nr:metal-dependent transcriptional regulator [Vicinamibacterales bacterium]
MSSALVAIGALLVLIAGGAIATLLDRREASRRRVRIEDALKHLFDQEYRGRRGSFASLGGALRLDDRRLMQMLARMQQQGLVVASGQEFNLTLEGERVARQVVRAHRLLERYFADEARIPLRDVHAAAERQEHSITPEQVDALAASLGHPRQDPHGDPIPGRDGDLSPAGDTPVTAWPADQFGRITHLEDEPPIAFAQILAEGLTIGQVVRIVESSPARLVLSDGENEYRLAPAVAANVFLAPAPAPAASGLIRLADLPDGQAAQIVALDAACQGFSRRRLMDLGFTPGARIEPALRTFAGDPRGYRVRGTLVALRRDQSRQVLVRLVPDAEAASLENVR